jgi:hypothetical protein
MLRVAGFSIEQRLEEEVYLCRRQATAGAKGVVYPARAPEPRSIRRS